MKYLQTALGLTAAGIMLLAGCAEQNDHGTGASIHTSSSAASPALSKETESTMATSTHAHNPDRSARTGHKGYDDGHVHGQQERVASGGLSTSQDGYTLWPDRRILRLGASETLTFRIIGPDGTPVTQYTPQHEHDLHVVVVRSDLKHFQHLHPTRTTDGLWSVPLSLPEGGTYRLLADFVTDDKAFVLGTNLFAEGPFAPASLPDASLTAQADGYRVTLDRPESIKPGSDLALRFSIQGRNGRAVSLTPVMGAGGHLVAIREGDLAYLHAHPASPAAPPDTSDASITFHLGVPSVGRYRLFLQFADADRLSTASFTLNVSPDAPTPSRKEDAPSPHGPHSGHSHH